MIKQTPGAGFSYRHETTTATQITVERQSQSTGADKNVCQRRGRKVALHHPIQNMVKRTSAVMDFKPGKRLRSLVHRITTPETGNPSPVKLTIPEQASSSPIHKAMGLMMKNMVEGDLDGMIASKEILTVYLDETYCRQAKAEANTHCYSLADIQDQYATWGDLIVNTPMADLLCQLYSDNQSALYEISVALDLFVSGGDFSDEHQGSWVSQNLEFIHSIARKLLSNDALSKFEHGMSVATQSRFFEPLLNKISGIKPPPANSHDRHSWP